MQATTNGSRLEPSTNGRAPKQPHPRPLPNAESAIDTLDLLTRITPEEIRRTLDRLEDHFREERTSYKRNKKLLSLMLGASAVRRRKVKGLRRHPSPGPAHRAATDRQVLDLVRQRGSVDRDAVMEALDWKRNGATAKLKALVRRGELQEKNGQFSLAN